jgi:Ras-related protein Rab-21
MGLSAHKVVLLGNTKVGKTSLLIRKLTGEPLSRVNPTIGVNCHSLEIKVGDIPVSLSIWDTAGQEVYYSVVPIYLREAKAALLVCDIADRFSFEKLDWSSKMVVEEVGSSAALFVVANKIDLEPDRCVSRSTLKAFAEDHGAKLFEVSALTGAGIDAMFYAVAEGILALAKPAAAVTQMAGSDSSCC